MNNRHRWKSRHPVDHPSASHRPARILLQVSPTREGMPKNQNSKIRNDMRNKNRNNKYIERKTKTENRNRKQKQKNKTKQKDRPSWLMTESLWVHDPSITLMKNHEHHSHHSEIFCFFDLICDGPNIIGRKNMKKWQMISPPSTRKAIEIGTCSVPFPTSLFHECHLPRPSARSPRSRFGNQKTVPNAPLAPWPSKLLPSGND